MAPSAEMNAFPLLRLDAKLLSSHFISPFAANQVEVVCREEAHLTEETKRTFGRTKPDTGSAFACVS